MIGTENKQELARIVTNLHSEMAQDKVAFIGKWSLAKEALFIILDIAKRFLPAEYRVIIEEIEQFLREF